jgi:hypothetical protein
MDVSQPASVLVEIAIVATTTSISVSRIMYCPSFW